MNSQRKLTTRLAVLAAGPVLVLGLAACGSSSSSTKSSSSSGSGATAPSSGSAVSIKDFKYSPESVTVKAGTAVDIKNDDAQPHTFTSDTSGVFDSGSIRAGGSPDTPVVVMTAGEYAFHCKFHAFMHGKLIVQ
ncbi:MAG: cupredoxin domain-containing protein [Acidimicrobiales bacterium]